MSTKPIQNLVLVAKQAAAKDQPSAAQQRRMAVCALEIARADAWEELAASQEGLPAAVQGHMQDALEYAVEHPVLVDTQGRAFNGRLFLLPVSQFLEGDTALAYLPYGEVIQQMLTDALCPGGVGILLNKLLPEAVLAQLSLKDTWRMAEMAFERLEPGSAEAGGPLFIELDEGATSGLHFVPFLAFASGTASDALLGLEGDELAVRSLSVMEAINPLLVDAFLEAGQFGVHACVHIPQSFFYEPAVVDLAHESFLFAISLNSWVEVADEEGRRLELHVSLESVDDHTQVLVRGADARVELGRFAFAVDSVDDEMVAEVCAGVTEIARSHALSVHLPKGLAVSVHDDYEPGSKTLALVDGPTTLQ